MQKIFYDSLSQAVREFGPPPLPLWTHLLGELSGFTESKCWYMQAIERLVAGNTLTPFAKVVAEFFYNLVLLEEKLRAGEQTGLELAELLHKAYRFMRDVFIDYELKKQQQSFRVLELIVKALRLPRLLRVLKTLAIEVVALAKQRLQLVFPEEPFAETLIMLVSPPSLIDPS